MKFIITWQNQWEHFYEETTEWSFYYAIYTDKVQYEW